MGRYRRTVSFPDPTPFTRSSTKPVVTSKSLHVRSASLPCSRSNPLIPQLRDEINQLRSNSMNRTGLGSVCDGLNRMKCVLDSLDDVLQLPQTLDSLSSSTSFIERLLEGFLSFVDVYGMFQGSLLGLKQELAEAQVAIRRKDIPKLGLHLKAQKKIANEISKLVGSISTAEQPSISTVDDEELGRVICDVHQLTSSVSAGLFGVFGLGRKSGWAGLGLGLSRRGKKEEEVEEFHEVIEGVERIMGLRKNKKSEEKSEEIKKLGLLKRMQEMEDCVGEMEKGCERVLRSLISTRVSLLNVLTHA